MQDNVPAVGEFDTLRRVRILVVGAGAIGQVYAHHLIEGGAEVSFLVREKYAKAVKEGLDLHHYGLAGMRPKRHIKGVDVYTDHRRLRALTFHQIWLCVSSPALRGDWLGELANSCPNVIWVSFQPGVEDREYLAWKLQTQNVICGLVNFVAYQAPLPGEDLWPEGIAFYVPPMSMTSFHGPEPHVSVVANLLQKGKFAAGVNPATIAEARFGSSVLVPFVVALESIGWDWNQLRSNVVLLELLALAITDLQLAVEKATGRTPGGLSFFQKVWFWKFALFAAPKAASFPIETYFKFHFSKVRDQTDQMVDDFVQLCRDNAIISRSLESLRDSWRARRARAGQPPPSKRLPAREQETTPVPAVGVLPVVKPTPAPARVNSDVAEPTRPMSTGAIPVISMPDEPTPPLGVGVVPPAAAPMEPIKVDFDFGEPGTHGPEADGLEEPTADGMDEAAAANATRVEEEEDDVEMAEVRAPGILLRSLSDLDNVPAIKDDDTPPPIKVSSKPVVGPALPFAVDEMAAPNVPAPEPEPEPTPELPSIIVDEEQLTDEVDRPPQPTILDPGTAPQEVLFGNAVPEEQRSDVQRRDFVQTELANESQNASLRELKSRLRSRLGSKQGLSPALKKDPDDQ